MPVEKMAGELYKGHWLGVVAAEDHPEDHWEVTQVRL